MMCVDLRPREDGTFMRLFGVLLTGLMCIAVGAAHAAPTKGVPLSTVLRGKVESMEGRRVRVVYDFSSPTHTLDFVEVNPFLATAAGSWRIESRCAGSRRWRRTSPSRSR